MRAEHLLALMHRDHRPFGEDVEVLVGYDRGDLDDEIGVGLKARHLQIDPDEILGARDFIVCWCSVPIATSRKCSRGPQSRGRRARRVLAQLRPPAARCSRRGRACRCALTGPRAARRVRRPRALRDRRAPRRACTSIEVLEPRRRRSSASTRAAAPSRSPPTSTRLLVVLAPEPGAGSVRGGPLLAAAARLGHRRRS